MEGESGEQVGCELETYSLINKITACRPNGSVILFAKRNNEINHVVESTLALIGKKYILRNRIRASA